MELQYDSSNLMVDIVAEKLSNIGACVIEIKADAKDKIVEESNKLISEDKKLKQLKGDQMINLCMDRNDNRR